MKKRILKSCAAYFLLLATVLSLCGCGKKEHTMPDLNVNLQGRTNKFSYSAQPSQPLQLSVQSADQLLQELATIKPEYPYAYLYELDTVKENLDFDASVQTHKYNALDTAGILTANHLQQLVKKNNEDFMAAKPFGYTSVEEDYIAKLCDFIVRVVHIMEQKYPNIDWPRVYCNLGNLKILYNTGMLSYAQVSQEMILSISKNNTSIVLNMKGEDGFSRVMTHEIMHILQIGCCCEEIPGCSRRAGIALYLDDFTLNTTDWTWFVEGSAERHMCTLTGGEAVSYQYKMDYICSMTMSTLLRKDVNADTMETICFYDDPQLLFDAFGCQTQAQQDELLNMMITLQILQMQPPSFYAAYKAATGEDLQADEEKQTLFSYALKPAVCITLAKEFYENLIPFMQEKSLTSNDLFFLINLFEGHLNQHLNYTNTTKAEINAPFLTAYTKLRSAFFSALEIDNPGLDIVKRYTEYTITGNGENSLNAELHILSAEKRAFLAERAQWLFDLKGLGQKVPQ